MTPTSKNPTSKNPPSDDDMKKKFREALDKKNHRATPTTEHKDGGPITRKCFGARASEQGHGTNRKAPSSQMAWRVLCFVAPTGFEPALPP